MGSYAELPPVALLQQYMTNDEERRAFVESMALVKVKQGECIMRQGARGTPLSRSALPSERPPARGFGGRCDGTVLQPM